MSEKNFFLISSISIYYIICHITLLTISAVLFGLAVSSNDVPFIIFNISFMIFHFIAILYHSNILVIGSSHDTFSFTDKEMEEHRHKRQNTEKVVEETM